MQSKLGFKSKYALYDKRLSLFCLYDPVSELFFTRNEIEVRNIRLLAVKYVVYLGIEELRIYCVYGFEILQIGLRPSAISCMQSFLALVVFPEELGPASSTSLLPLRFIP